MAVTPEKKVKNKVVEVLKKYAAYYFFPATYGYGRSGVPDIIVCYRGRFIGIECKAGKNKLTALQERELVLITRAAGLGVVVNEENVGEIAELVSSL